MDHGTPFIDLATINFTSKMLGVIPREVALQRRVMPVFDEGEMIGAAIADLNDLDAMDAVCLAAGRHVQWYHADPLQLTLFVERCYALPD